MTLEIILLIIKIRYPRQDGSFVARGIPTGSYVVEISHPVFTFEPQRVDISAKGKIRARRPSILQVCISREFAE